MTDAKFTDRATLSAPRITSDGYLVASVLCARTGCQDYLASELGMDGGGKVTVFRPESAVFVKDSLATFAGKPVTIGHPSEGVTADNWRTYAVGDIGTDIARDGEFVRVDIKLMDAAAIKAVQGGTREVSMGYTTPMEMRDGVAPDGTPYQAVQTGPIRINHLAIVPTARGGSQLRIGDGAGNWGAAPIPTTDQKGSDMTDTLQPVVLGDAAVNVPSSIAPAIEKFKVDTAKSLADAVAAHDKALAAKDAELAAKDALIKELEGQVLTADALDQRIADRAAVIAKARAHVADLDPKGMTDAAIKKAAVAKVHGDKVKDKSDAYIDAAFDLLSDAKAAPGADPLAKPLGDGGKADFNDEYRATLSSAWMTKPGKEG